MAVSPALADLETPLTIAMSGSAIQTAGAHSGTLHISELPPGAGQAQQRFVAVLASSLQSPPNPAHEELAVQAVLSTVSASGEVHLAEQMKTSFREANRSIHQASQIGPDANSDSEGVAMLALLTNGKYATLGLVGQDRAYLARARRLTRLTRDQRIERARSRRKRDIEEREEIGTFSRAVRLLGEVERLDSRSPAIFEITLLPEDRLALLSHGLAEQLQEDTILAALESGPADSLADVILAGQHGPQGPMLAAVLQVPPSQETMLPLPVAPAQSRGLLWPAFLLLLVVLLIAAGLVLLVV